MLVFKTLLSIRDVQGLERFNSSKYKSGSRPSYAQTKNTIRTKSVKPHTWKDSALTIPSFSIIEALCEFNVSESLSSFLSDHSSLRLKKGSSENCELKRVHRD
ncbi:hypothetical protein P8452_63692 [Trifolium repens]|nr:hypothetical protein P8452_63692 [Trifolium repens]